jgi:membrane-bound inhibitor of C-type lysozyme
MLVAVTAMAHGDKTHVIGTVEKVATGSVTVKTADGKSVEVKLVSGTIYVWSDGKSASLSDLAAGERVVIHATPNGDTLSADEVRFSPLAAGARGSSAAKPN